MMNVVPRATLATPAVSPGGLAPLPRTARIPATHGDLPDAASQVVSTVPLSHGKLMRSIELYGTRVAPLVRDMLAD